jgi:hypothetical protein
MLSLKEHLLEEMKWILGIQKLLKTVVSGESLTHGNPRNIQIRNYVTECHDINCANK